MQFVDRPALEKLDMGFPFHGHEVRKVEYVIVKYKHLRDTYVTSDG